MLIKIALLLRLLLIDTLASTGGPAAATAERTAGDAWHRQSVRPEEPGSGSRYQIGVPNPVVRLAMAELVSPAIAYTAVALLASETIVRCGRSPLLLLLRRALPPAISNIFSTSTKLFFSCSIRGRHRPPLCFSIDSKEEKEDALRTN